MERVAFLIEPHDVRISCMLNPETITVHRQSGITTRKNINGALTGKHLNDDPLLFTGGGRTWLDLKLLFDISIPGSTVISSDVRDLTEPFFNLTEAAAADYENGRPPAVRMVWGKHWNFLGVISEVAETLDIFSPEGTPKRSWLTLRLLRIPERDFESSFFDEWLKQLVIAQEVLEILDMDAPFSENVHQEFIENNMQTVVSNDRPDALAHKFWGSSVLWRFIAIVNETVATAVSGTGSHVLVNIPPLFDLLKRL